MERALTKAEKEAGSIAYWQYKDSTQEERIEILRVAVSDGIKQATDCHTKIWDTMYALKKGGLPCELILFRFIEPMIGNENADWP